MVCFDFRFDFDGEGVGGAGTSGGNRVDISNEISVGA